MERRIQLEEGARVIVLGGGPAGAFFSIHLLSMAAKAGKKIRVTIAEKHGPSPRGDEARGCNRCAGVVSPRLAQGLRNCGIYLPDSVLCQRFSHIWIHGQWKNFPLKVPRGTHVLSVFRGSLPGGRSEEIRGFDAFLLEKAGEMGAELIRADAMDFSLTRGGRVRVLLAAPDGARQCLEGEFLAVCTGINAGAGPGISPVFQRFSRLNPGFRPPLTRKTLIFELKPGRSYLKKYMDRELHIVVSGDRELDLDHAALVPKRDCLTVALVGKSIDRAVFPKDIPVLVRAFFALDGIREILPGLTPENTPAICTCTPLMAVAPARFSCGHRMALAGDAFGARLYRDGLYSAFAQTRDLAAVVIERGVDRASLSPACEAAGQWLSRDNARGRCLMGLAHRVLKSPFFSRVLYQTFATEMKFRTMDQWPVGRLLWQIGSGEGDFGSPLKVLAAGPVLRSGVRGVVKTLRNMATELFFGLDWERYGRYPAVVIRKKRQAVKASVSRSLGVTLDPTPEMERMYAVKIRADAPAIFRELGRFGEPGSRFLRLRFVDVKRVKGPPNGVGAVVRYRLVFPPLSMDIRLVKRVEDRGLVYEPSPLFTRNGKLIFQVRPTRDGNHRLVVYTAFDYRRGERIRTRWFWALFRGMFPDFAHDVVWNHAVCTIKAEAEKAAAR